MNSRRLIADGGSTKVHWVIAEENSKLHEFFSDGINPAVMLPQTVAQAIAKALQTVDLTGVTSVEFYGAGCKGTTACSAVADALRPFAGNAKMTVASDMVGVCRALLANKPGVACILGTGANSCLYNGHEIVANVSPGGFILGDEGSGAWLGKNLVADLLKGILPEGITTKFNEKYGLDAAALIQKIYRPTPNDLPANRFLASLAPFLKENIAVTEIRAIVLRGFREFFHRNVIRYFNEPSCGKNLERSVHFVGSIALAFADELRQVAAEEKCEVAQILKSPMDGLVSYNDGKL